MWGKCWKLGVRVALALALALGCLAAADASAARARISEVRTRAEAGEALAQADLAWRYYQGKGVRKDDAEAVRWMRRAAEQGVANAQFNMAYFLTTGVAGEPKPADYEQAIVWYARAESNGLARAREERFKAILNLGYELETGRRFPADVERAAVLYQEAAEGGNASAQYNLGLLLSHGKGVERDSLEAARWLRAAEAQGHAEARAAREANEALAALERDGLTVVVVNPSSPDSVRAKAEGGDAASQLRLALLLRGGSGVDRSESESLRWLKAAAENGDATAQAELAAMYHAGDGVPQSYAQAAAWYRKSAEQGNSRAQSSLGAMCVNGEGIERDLPEGLKWIYISYAREHMSRYLVFRLERDVDERVFAEGRRLADAWFEAHDLAPTRYGPKPALNPI